MQGTECLVKTLTIINTDDYEDSNTGDIGSSIFGDIQIPKLQNDDTWIKCAYLSVEIIGNYDSNLVANETYNDFNSELNKWNSLPVYRKIKELLLHSTNLLSEAGFNMKFNTDKDKEDRWGTVGSISNIYSSDLDNSNSNDYDISDYDYTIEFNYDNNDSNFNQPIRVLLSDDIGDVNNFKLRFV